MDLDNSFLDFGFRLDNWIIDIVKVYIRSPFCNLRLLNRRKCLLNKKITYQKGKRKRRVNYYKQKCHPVMCGICKIFGFRGFRALSLKDFRVFLVVFHGLDKAVVLDLRILVFIRSG
jgi:hypothetical protein